MQLNDCIYLLLFYKDLLTQDALQTIQCVSHLNDSESIANIKNNNLK